MQSALHILRDSADHYIGLGINLDRLWKLEIIKAFQKQRRGAISVLMVMITRRRVRNIYLCVPCDCTFISHWKA